MKEILELLPAQRPIVVANGIGLRKREAEVVRDFILTQAQRQYSFLRELPHSQIRGGEIVSPLDQSTGSIRVAYLIPKPTPSYSALSLRERARASSGNVCSQTESPKILGISSRLKRSTQAGYSWA